MKKLVIIGAGGLGREIIDTVKRINLQNPTYEILGFIDDNRELEGVKVNETVVLGNKEWLKAFSEIEEIYAVIAIANYTFKKEIVQFLGGSVQWENIIDPSALISNYAKIGMGNIIQPFSVVGPNTEIGNHVVINLRTNIGHDACIEDFVSIMSTCDITGGVQIKEAAYIATSVAIVPGVTIGTEAFICAGAVVLKDVEDRTKVIGYPAKRIL